ncbi:MAG: DUF4403 family protein [Cyclobacteriaceae bacterium]
MDTPEKLARTKVYEQQVSDLNIPFVFDIKQLELIINQSLPTTFYSDKSYFNNNNDGLKLEATKANNIKIAEKNGALTYSIPVSLLLDYKKSLAIKSNAKIEVSYATTFSVTDDWKIKTTTTSSGYSWIEKPTITNFFVKVTIPDLVLNAIDDELQKQLSKVATIIDTQISKKLDFTQSINDIWSRIQEPSLIDSTHKVWLKATPTNFAFSTLDGNDRNVFLKSSISLSTDIVVGGKPKITPIKTLPPIVKSETISDSFSLAFTTNISYLEINKIVKKELVGYTYTSNNKKIVITETDITANGDYLYAKLSFTGSVNGTMYLRGIPAIDIKTNEIYLENLDFDIKSKKTILSIADFLVHGTFKRKIDSFMRIPLNEYFEEAEQGIEQNVQELVDIPITIDCDVTDFTPENIYLTDTQLKAVIYVSGKAVVAYGIAE